MKRLMLGALLLGLATAVRSLPADDQPAPGAPPNTAPQVQQPTQPPPTNVAPAQPPANSGQPIQQQQPQQQPPASAPSGINPNSLGNASAPNTVVENGASRGALGGLVSGAPSVATTIPQNPGATFAQLGNAAAPAATTVVGTATTIVQQRMTVVPKPASIPQHCDLIARTMLHCMTRSPREFKLNAGPRFVPVGGFFPFPPLPAGDLELLGLVQIGEAPGNCPIYRISFRNNSPVAARNFRVSLIGAVGRVEFDSAVISVDIDEIAAKATMTTELTLPVAALAIGPPGRQAPFDTLVVALDSFDELPETDEMNNVASFKRGEIVAMETITTVAPVGGPNAAPVAVPGSGPAAAQPQISPNSEVDRIDLDKVNGAATLFSK